MKKRKEPVTHSRVCQLSLWTHARAKRRLILGGKRLEKCTRATWSDCPSCSSNFINLSAENFKKFLCPEHESNALLMLFSLRKQRKGVYRLNRQYRHQYIKHHKMMKIKTLHAASYVPGNYNYTYGCPEPSFPSFDYATISLRPPSDKSNTHPKHVSLDQNVYERKMFTPWNFGHPTFVCDYCGALTWYQERVKKTSTSTKLMFSICCQSGKVELPKYKKCPNYLLHLLDYNGGTECRKFRENIRAYNSIFAFTSMGGRIDNSINNGRGPYVFRINGQNHHRIGSLLPTSGTPKFAQLYFYDSSNEVAHRMNAQGGSMNRKLDEEIIKKLISMFDDCNGLAKVFRMARDRFEASEYQSISIRLLERRYRDGRQYNLPTTSEIAALNDTDNVQSCGFRDIVIEERNGILKRINEKHPCFMSMQYPLLFPYGEDGYRRNIEYRAVEEFRKTKREMVTMREYYAYLIQYRSEDGSVLLLGGRIFQQFVVDCYTCIEEERLSWVRSNQTKLRSEVYNGLHDAITSGDTSAHSIGKKVILPSSFTGGPRYMVQNYQDAMAICRWAGSPDYFVTFTCNPKWPEITAALDKIPGQRTEDRPDIVSRVFQIKLAELIKDIKDESHFGRVKALIYTIEFQKRGLPHAHMLIFVCGQQRPKTVGQVDRMVSAEIPDIKEDPFAYQSICQFMIHGPCGQLNPECPCMVAGACSKHYPKDYCSETTFDKNGFPVYRRRNNGRSTLEENGFSQDNGWVIPHNVDLVVKYQAHVNVEICNRARSIKYLFKYINKGHDRASVVIEDNNNTTHTFVREIDEVKTYLDCRYISASEAIWRIFEFDIQFRTPAVERLMFHMPGEHTVYFDDTDNLIDVQCRPNLEKTMFTQWLETNKRCPDARQLTYVDFPTSWVWDKKTKEWKMRKKGDKIGRIYYAHPTAGERFYLRMLLNVVKGPTCYKEIRTVSGVVYEDYKTACVARGLLEDDNEWDDALNEAGHWASPKSLREMFAMLLLFCEISNPAQLWTNHWELLSEDIRWRRRRESTNANYEPVERELKSNTLQEIERIMNINNRSLKEFWSIPPTEFLSEQVKHNTLIREEEGYDYQLLEEEVNRMLPCLNEEQKIVFDVVQHSVKTGCGGFFFVYGSGGTGKTFLWKTLLSSLRSEGRIVLAVASSGIASLLLPGGRTAHSKFKIPINLDDASTCNISKQSCLADLLRKTDLIIWDEAPMIHRNALEAFEKSLNDIVSDNSTLGSDQIFGGKTVVLGGDFRQTLPVVPKGTRQMIVRSAVNHSALWKRCRVFILKTNMRLRASNTGAQELENLSNFSKWILDVGEGKLPSISLEKDEDPTWIHIPNEYLIPPAENAIEEIVNVIYPDLEKDILLANYLRDRCILAPTNDCVEEINSYVIAAIHGTMKSYLSADSISPISDTAEDQNILYPPEFLNTIKISGLPNHNLRLKIGVPIMLLRNLNQSLGLCNGTRLIVTQLGSRIIEGEIITGNNIGRKVLIPRIILTSNDTKWPFILRRRQFPVKVCFAMTINKSQGQTLDHVGIYLPRPVFTHGQLYVAISRTTSHHGLKIMLGPQDHGYDTYTQNIVYKEVFHNLVGKHIINFPTFIHVKSTSNVKLLKKITVLFQQWGMIQQLFMKIAINSTPMKPNYVQFYLSLCSLFVQDSSMEISISYSDEGHMW